MRLNSDSRRRVLTCPSSEPSQNTFDIREAITGLDSASEQYLLLWMLHYSLMPRWHGEFGERLRLKSAAGLFQAWNGGTGYGNSRVYTDACHGKVARIIHDWWRDLVAEYHELELAGGGEIDGRRSDG